MFGGGRKYEIDPKLQNSEGEGKEKKPRETTGSEKQKIEKKGKYEASKGNRLLPP